MAVAQQKNFINREVFQRVLDEVRTVAGTPYSDPDTVFGDLSRLVVGWLARVTPAEIVAEYQRAGWKGDPHSRALHEAAKRWFEIHPRHGAE